MRRITVLSLIAVAATAVPATAAQAAPFKATLKTPSTQPRVNKHWKITVTARSNSGKPLRATAKYQFLYDGQVVSTQYPDPGHDVSRRHSPYPFTGKYTDSLLFPARARGFPLTFRVVVTVKGKGTINLDKAVRVRK